MKRFCLSIVLLAAPHAWATPVPAASTQATEQDLAHLRAALGERYNAGDVEGMLQYLHPEVLILFPDGEALHGREAFKAYYDKQLKAADSKVKSFASNPSVEGRQVRGDVDLSWGTMNDRYVLRDGNEFALNSKFTATLIKLDPGPADTGGWVIRSFHASTNAFDNPVLAMAAKRSLTFGLIGGTGLGLLLGLAMSKLLRRKPTETRLPQLR